MSRWLLSSVVALLLVSAASRPVAAQAVGFGCTPVQQNLFVRRAMTDIYLWYQAIPDVDPARFDSPEAYLDAIRYLPLDRTYSYITSSASNEAFFSNSQFIGVGLSMAFRGNELRVTQVYAGSSADEAGLSRGDQIVAIDGRPVIDLLRAGAVATAFGPDEIGVAVQVTVLRSGVSTEARLTKRLVTIPTVSLARIYRVGTRTVGYLVFRNFVEPSFEALDRAFEEFRAGGVNELVLDVRYNGGGLVSVAQHLGSLIGGVRTDGQVFASYVHNDKHTFRDRNLRFQTAAAALGLERLLVITTRSSASASELVINALRPFMPVIVVGDRTYGKPVGQYQATFCDKVLAPVSFSMKNANGEGDFFDGIQPTCPAEDDLDHEFGDLLEGSFQEALMVIHTGGCSAPRAASPRRVSEPARPASDPGGWREFIGAY